MTVLLITGAGASRNLGQRGETMPLMADWADALCGALDAEEAGLAEACGLTSGMDGPTFEKNLGLLLRWQQVRHLQQRFAGLGGKKVGDVTSEITGARKRAENRLRTVMAVLNATLYEQFGQGRIDDEKAAQAYGPLLKRLGPDIVVATTNYDRSVETALVSLGFEIDSGFRVRPHRTPLLEPANVVRDRDSKIPVLHLHGAVGWYEREGSVGEHAADQPFNPSLGTPVVLYPDPDKDPTNDAVVSQLWAEFQEAVGVADAIVVVGHSLHDPALCRTLAAVGESKPVLISFFTEEDADRIEQLVPAAAQFELDFDPERKLTSMVLEALSNTVEHRALSTAER